MIEAMLSVKIPEMWVCEITEKYPIRLRFLSCMPFETGGRAVIEVHGEESILEKALAEIPSCATMVSTVKGRRTISCEGKAQDCEACKYIIMSGCFLVTPFGGEKGYMDWLLVTNKKESISFLIENLKNMGCDVKIKRMTDLSEKKILTERQEDIIKYALENGYFEFPKKIGIRQVAQKFDVSIATISEILRSAQQKIVGQYFGQ